jgi:MarR family transcriptional regulator, 2-MHQ and catechol-resistance regulon repressor
MNEKELTSVESIVDNLFFITPLISRALKHSLRNKTTLNPISWWVLKLVYRNEMLTMSEIGCKLQIPKPHVTAQIDKLIAEELVERFDDPNDRRIINIRLTELGKKSHEKIAKDISEDMKQRIMKLDAQKRTDLLDASQRVRAILMEIMD